MGESPQSDKPRLSLVVEEELKEQIDSKTGKNEEYRTMAELVRTSVQRELDGHHRRESQPTEGSMDLSPVLERFDRLETTLEEIDQRLMALESGSRASGPEFDIQRAIFEILPQELTPPRLPVEDIRSENFPSTEKVAKKVGASFEDVESALRKLEDNATVVSKRDTEAGTTYWWREEREE
jgi:Arc/MetJ-type ribon-helix-helix transcriptional regulator